MKHTGIIAALLVFVSLAFATPAQASSNVAWATPNLTSGFTPQGMTMLGSNVVMAEYKEGANTRLVEVNPKTGKVVGQVSIAPTHAGGIAVVGAWMYVQNADTPDHDTVRAYKVSDLHFTKHPTYVKSNHLQELDKWQYASFMTASGSQLLSGHHGIGSGSRMYRFNVDQKSGKLTMVSYVMVPNNTQGVSSAGAVFTSGGGHLTVNGIDHKIASHAEGVVVIKGWAYVAFENGAKSVLKYKV